MESLISRTPSTGWEDRERSGLRRSNSERSSTDSDILVASAKEGSKPKLDFESSTTANFPVRERRIVAEIRNVQFLVVLGRDDDGRDSIRELLSKMNQEDEMRRRMKPAYVASDVRIKNEIGDDDGGEGPNHRGTYSKEYTIAHPEVKWVHRGQGRYLPMSAAKAVTQSHAQQRETRLKESPRASTDGLQPPRSSRSSRYQGVAADDEDAKERVPSLRRRITDVSAGSTPDQRSSRLGRRTKPEAPIELERRSSRISTTIDYEENSDFETDDTNEMGGRSKETTYDKNYVDAHPEEIWHHTGNGYYRKGKKPAAPKNAKNRDKAGHAVKRRADGSYEFNQNTTIHVSQLASYPGVEFHHCGNGWYRAGPDQSGLRSSRYGGPVDFGEDEIGDEDGDGEDVDQGEQEIDDVGFEEEEDADEDESANGTVSKAYTLLHPEYEWIHRGKGRYRRKDDVKALSVGTPVSGSGEPERDQAYYTKAYKEVQSNEKARHRSNARHMRGSSPAQWSSSRRKKLEATMINPSPSADGDELFSTDYVNAHPGIQFHHRGQGRWARGPRKQSSVSVPASESDQDPQGLVDKAYVDAHPNETFHHRGQGRWARGMPPPGSSNKTAIRGPGLYDRSDVWDEPEDDEIDADGNKPPSLSSLLTRAEGPDLWPQLEWHYRGGGKWSRITKAQFEDLQRGNAPRKLAKPKGRLMRGSGPEAQLERETAAAVAKEMLEDDGFGIGYDMGEEGYGSTGKPKMKRRRMVRGASYQTQEDGMQSKRSSNAQSRAPTPKPRMLEPDEDVLTEEDLPQLYRDEWSPPSEYIDDPTERLSRNIRPMTNPDKFVKALLKHDPAIRPLDNLQRLAANAQSALEAIQAEYLELDKITAPHARIPRKVAKGGRAPVDSQIFEDRKEADLYDYNYDPRRTGFQDPMAQRIQRDAEGRELRNRRHRGTAINGTIPGWNFGEDEPLGPRRAVKPVNRFDGIVEAPKKRRGNSATATGRTSKAGSMTPDRGSTPLGGPIRAAFGGGRGRLTVGNVPKRIQELRGESVSRGVAGDGKKEGTPSSVRKGRPPGSKNLHPRKDAGIKKGPRKPKSIEGGEVGVEELEGQV